MYTKKHLLITACAGIILSALICLSIVAYQNTLRKGDTVALGTYATWSGQVPDCEYMVFTRDRQYYLYRQFEPLDSGVFSMREEGVYTLISSRGKGSLDILVRENTVYRTNDDGTLFAYPQISDIANFVNLSAADF